MSEMDILYDDWTDFYEAASNEEEVMFARATVPCLSFLDPYAQDPLLPSLQRQEEPIYRNMTQQTEDEFFREYPEAIERDIEEDGEEDCMLVENAEKPKEVDPEERSKQSPNATDSNLDGFNRFSYSSQSSVVSQKSRLDNRHDCEIQKPAAKPVAKPNATAKHPYGRDSHGAPQISNVHRPHTHQPSSSRSHRMTQPNNVQQPPSERPPLNPYSKPMQSNHAHVTPTFHNPVHPAPSQAPHHHNRSQHDPHSSRRNEHYRGEHPSVYPPVNAPNQHTPTNHQFGNEWDAFNAQQRNPFQTAREFQQQSDPRALQPRHVPQPEPKSPQQQPPPIRDSLKRKFKPPRAQSQVPKRKPVTNSTQRRQLHNNATEGDTGENKDDDDDLPEELKRFGKDLVEAIENEIIDNGEKISFREIAGLADQKAIVQEVVCWPLKRPDLFTGLRRAPNGLLLYGPPGTGKTLIGKAIATEANATFFAISSSSITSKWMGQGEKLVRTLFGVAAYREPSVVFIDEIDSLLTARKADENEANRRIKTEFLVQLDGVASKARVLVVGATNRPGELDEAARRRFTKRLYIPLPSMGDREQLLRELLSKSRHKLKEEDIFKLSRDTEGFSGADLKSLSVDAAMGPLRDLGPAAFEEIRAEDLPAISLKHFKRSLRGMSASVSPQDLLHYEEWDKLYGTKRSDDDKIMSDSDDEGS